MEIPRRTSANHPKPGPGASLACGSGCVWVCRIVFCPPVAGRGRREHAVDSWPRRSVPSLPWREHPQSGAAMFFLVYCRKL